MSASAKSGYQRWLEWRKRVMANSQQYETVKERQRKQKRKERAKFKERATDTQLEAKRAADRERQRRRRARLKAAKLGLPVPDARPGSLTVAADADAAEADEGGCPWTSDKYFGQNQDMKPSKASMKIKLDGLLQGKRLQKMAVDNPADDTKLHKLTAKTLNLGQSKNGRNKLVSGSKDAQSAQIKPWADDIGVFPAQNNVGTVSSGTSALDTLKRNQPAHKAHLKERTSVSSSKEPNANYSDHRTSGRRKSRKQSFPLKYIA